MKGARHHCQGEEGLCRGVQAENLEFPLNHIPSPVLAVILEQVTHPSLNGEGSGDSHEVSPKVHSGSRVLQSGQSQHHHGILNLADMYYIP